MPISQDQRLRIAIEAMRGLFPPNLTRPLNAAARSQFASRLMSEKWFRRTFTMSRFGWKPSWKGDQLTVLHELSHYVMPRQLWARPRDRGEVWVRRETCWSFVTLMQHVYGREIAKKVRAVLTDNGVKYRPRRIVSAAQKAALIARGFGPKKRVLAKGATVPSKRRISFVDE